MIINLLIIDPCVFPIVQLYTDLISNLKTTSPTIYEIVQLVGVGPLYKYCVFTGKLPSPEDPICQQICPLSQLVCTTSPICDCVNNPGELYYYTTYKLLIHFIQLVIIILD